LFFGEREKWIYNLLSVSSCSYFELICYLKDKLV